MIRTSWIFPIVVLAIVLTTAACKPLYKTEYRFEAPPTSEGRVCANNCLNKLDTCAANCRSQEAECRRIKSLEAENDYLYYVNEQLHQGLPVEKEKRDFEHYGDCSTNCEDQCSFSHRLCHTNCGGQVIEHVYCWAFCDAK